MLIEAMAQSALVLHYVLFGPAGPMYLARADARFRHPVHPGERVRIHAEPVKVLPRIGLVRARASVCSLEVATCEVGFGAAPG